MRCGWRPDGQYHKSGRLRAGACPLSLSHLGVCSRASTRERTTPGAFGTGLCAPEETCGQRPPIGIPQTRDLQREAGRNPKKDAERSGHTCEMTRGNAHRDSLREEGERNIVSARSLDHWTGEETTHRAYTRASVFVCQTTPTSTDTYRARTLR